jgi:hypothetical protein
MLGIRIILGIAGARWEPRGPRIRARSAGAGLGQQPAGQVVLVPACHDQDDRPAPRRLCSPWR